MNDDLTPPRGGIVDTERARRWATPDEDGEDTALDLERMKIMHALADTVDALRAERALLVRVEEAARLEITLCECKDDCSCSAFKEQHLRLALAALDKHRERKP